MEPITEQKELLWIDFNYAVAVLSIDVVENIIALRPLVVNQSGYRGRYAVHEASRVEMLRLLVRHGAQLNVHDDDGQTPLHVASRYGNVQVLHELVCTGADWRAVDHHGRSAAHHAALGNAVEVIHYLVEVCGLSTSLLDSSRRSPLHLACSKGHHAAVMYLLKNQRSDIEGRDAYGNTVLHLAAVNGRADVCRELMLLHSVTYANSSMIDVLNDDGCTPLDLAKCKPTPGNCRVIDLLSRLKYGRWHPDVVLVLDDARSWRWALLMPWFIYVSVCILLYVVADGTAAGLLALCATVTFVTIVATNGHRISDDNRLPNPVHASVFAGGMFHTTLTFWVVLLPETYGELNKVFVWFVIVLSFIAFYMYKVLITTKAGIFPRETISLSQYTVMDVAVGRDCKFCGYCETVTTVDSGHCRLCRRCVYRRDHHCLYLNRCVAADTRRLFVAFLLVALALIASFEYISVVYLRRRHAWPSLDWRMLADVFDSEVAVWPICVLDALAACLLSVLAVQQLVSMSGESPSCRQQSGLTK